MSFFLRLAGITNAALWFGAGIFFAAVVWPAFSSSEMLRILPPSHSGAAAQIVLERHFAVQYWCGAIALGHFLLECLYAGKPWHRWTLYLIIGILGLTLFNGLSVQPRLKRLHLETYGMRSTPAQRGHARKAAELWLTTFQASQVVVLFGLWVYLWEITSAGSAAKSLMSGKFRG